MKTILQMALRMNQTDFSRLVNVSRRSLTQIESDAIDLSEETLNRVFNIFGLQVGLQLCSKNQVNKLFDQQH